MSKKIFYYLSLFAPLALYFASLFLPQGEATWRANIAGMLGGWLGSIAYVLDKTLDHENLTVNPDYEKPANILKIAYLSSRGWLGAVAGVAAVADVSLVHMVDAHVAIGLGITAGISISIFKKFKK